MSICLCSNVSKVPYHILLLAYVSEAAKIAALSHTSCLQEVPTTLQLGAILNIQVAFIRVQVTLQHRSRLDSVLQIDQCTQQAI